MRALNVLAAFAVLACNLVVSFNHSLDLFRAGGFTGGLEYVAVIGAEITFVMGALNLVVSRLKGYSPGAPAILGGLLGVALVGWSNVAAGWSYGVTGILLGLATPVSLIVAEAILARAALQRSAKKMETAKWSVERLEPDPPDDWEDEDEVPPTNGEEVTSKVEAVESVEGTPPVELEDTSQTMEAELEAVEKVEEYSPSSPLEWAVYLYKLEGRLPGRKRLTEMAGCSEWVARQALAELKKNIKEA